MMKTEYLGKKQGKIGIEVIDENESLHTVEVGLDGEIKFHGNDDYPHDRKDRTFEEQRVMTQVEARAKLAAQREFPEADILSIEWLPEGVERGIEALQTVHVDKFAEQFETCYEMVTAPERFEDVTEETAQLIHQPFFIDDSNDVVYIPTPIIQYRKDGEVQTTHRESGISQAP